MLRRIIFQQLVKTVGFVSSDDPLVRYTDRLHDEAHQLETLLNELLLTLNSAVEPQATLYRRIEHIACRARARRDRRKYKTHIAWYRSHKVAPSDIPAWHGADRDKIIAALQK